jgi:hypothetical protein
MVLTPRYPRSLLDNGGRIATMSAILGQAICTPFCTPKACLAGCFLRQVGRSSGSRGLELVRAQVCSGSERASVTVFDPVVDFSPEPAEVSSVVAEEALGEEA